MQSLSRYRIWILPVGAGIFFLFFWGTGCSTGSIEGESRCQNWVEVPCIPVGDPHPQLADYNLFEGTLKELKPIEDLVPYDLNTPLFSDYAQKFRLVYVPEDKTAGYRKSGVLDFPVGSVLVKNFYYDLNLLNPLDGRSIIETRLLMHYERGWVAETYVWNNAQTSATLQQSGDINQVSWVDKKGIEHNINYVIPTKNDCKTCHSSNGQLIPLGPEVRNLNKDYTYPDGVQNQLDRWWQAGLLEEIPDATKLPQMPVWNDPATGTIDERARTYLDVNCGSCHSNSGVAAYTGNFLDFEEQDSFRLGICKPPTASGGGSGGHDYDIIPCNPDASILVYRMNAEALDERMPEVGRTIVHEEAVSLIRQWIANMGCRTCE